MSYRDNTTRNVGFLPFVILILPVAIVVYRKYSYHNELEDLIQERKNHLSTINRIITHGETSKLSDMTNHPSQRNSSPSHHMVVESTSDFLHQVAGHTCEILRKFHFKVLKPMVKPKLFLREIELYEEMHILGSHCTQVARAFVATYYGVMNISNGDSDRPYLVLKDLTISYLKPCVIDIKMGTQTFEPSASYDKKTREHDKYSYQKSIGFRITGFKVYDITRSLFYSVDKSFGRSLKPEQVKDGLKLFFHNGRVFRRDILMIVIQRLENILTWFKSQIKLHFYCSSLLVVFDGYTGEPHHTCNVHNKQSSSTSFNSPFNYSSTLQHLVSSEQDSPRSVQQHSSKNSNDVQGKYYVKGSKVKSEQAAKNTSKLSLSTPTSHDRMQVQSQYRVSSLEEAVQVRMIDFAHSLPSTDTAPIPAVDEGYITGLVNLIAYLRSIVYDIDTGAAYDGVPEHLSHILQSSMTVSLE